MHVEPECPTKIQALFGNGWILKNLCIKILVSSTLRVLFFLIEIVDGAGIHDTQKTLSLRTIKYCPIAVSKTALYILKSNLGLDRMT